MYFTAHFGSDYLPCSAAALASGFHMGDSSALNHMSRFETERSPKVFVCLSALTASDWAQIQHWVTPIRVTLKEIEQRPHSSVSCSSEQKRLRAPTQTRPPNWFPELDCLVTVLSSGSGQSCYTGKVQRGTESSWPSISVFPFFVYA